MKSLGNPFHLNNLQLLQASSWMELLIFTPLLIVAGLQDRKTTYVKGEVCLLLGAALFLNAMYLSGMWLTPIVVILFLILTFAPVELKIFGQADFIIVCHFLTGYGFTANSVVWIMIAGIIWMVCLLVHVIIYRGLNGERWRPFSGVMIPAIPSYAASVLFVSIGRVLFTQSVFFSGW